MTYSTPPWGEAQRWSSVGDATIARARAATALCASDPCGGYWGCVAKLWLPIQLSTSDNSFPSPSVPPSSTTMPLPLGLAANIAVQREERASGKRESECAGKRGNQPGKNDPPTAPVNGRHPLSVSPPPPPPIRHGKLRRAWAVRNWIKSASIGHKSLLKKLVENHQISVASKKYGCKPGN